MGEYKNIKKVCLTIEEILIIIKQIDDLRKLLQLYEMDEIICNRHGNHFKRCIWSNNCVTSGPDTCECFIASYNMKRIKSLLQNLLPKIQLLIKFLCVQ